MAVPQNQQELLSAIRTTYQRLVADLVTVPAERVREASMVGHARNTWMSVSDLVAYLIGWNELVLTWCERKSQGLPVDFPDTGYKWNELGRLAQRFYADFAELGYPALLQRLDAAYTRIVARIEAENDVSLYGEPWYEKYTMGRMIQFNTSSPYANARGRLRKWKKDQGIA